MCYSCIMYVYTCVLARSFSRVTRVSCSLSIPLASYALSLAFIALSRSLRAYSSVCVCVCVKKWGGEGERGDASVFQTTYYISSTQHYKTPYVVLLALNYILWHYTTSHNIKQYHMTSHDITQYHMTSRHHMTSHNTTRYQKTPQDIT